MADARITLTLVGVPAGAETCVSADGERACPLRVEAKTAPWGWYCVAFERHLFPDGRRRPECRAAEEHSSRLTHPAVDAAEHEATRGPTPQCMRSRERVLCTRPQGHGGDHVCATPDGVIERWTPARWEAAEVPAPTPAPAVPATLPERCGDCEEEIGGYCCHDDHGGDVVMLDPDQPPPADCPLRAKETPRV